MMNPFRRAAGSILGALLGLLVVIIGVVVILMVYGFFIATYSGSGGLNSSLYSINNTVVNSTAGAINNFFGTTNSVLPLLSLVPLVIVASVIIYLIVSGFGGHNG